LTNSPSLTAVAASTYIMTILSTDTTQLLAQVQYTHTIVVTAATAVSNVSNVALLALALG
jgi:hypothetical protein